MSSTRRLTGVVGRWSAGHPWTVIAAWFGCVVVLLMTGHLVGTFQLPSSQSSAGESYQAQQMRSRDSPGHASEYVLFDSQTVRISSPALGIPVTAVILNLLSVGAAYGVIVALFQWGWGQSLLGFTSVHSVASWLPLFLFVVLFGLSMDYHVFILSRIRESYDRTGQTDQAVAHGIKTTAGVVTAAAIVMVFVFLTFATLSMVQLKEMGVGLAVAVLLDATIVRALLLPATMKLLGRRTSYLPRWLQWLPQSSEPALRPMTAGEPLEVG
jgi:uncharacterized membrane protein YdfJ with MMPL/SSD domain